MATTIARNEDLHNKHSIVRKINVFIYCVRVKE